MWNLLLQVLWVDIDLEGSIVRVPVPGVYPDEEAESLIESVSGREQMGQSTSRWHEVFAVWENSSPVPVPVEMYTSFRAGSGTKCSSV